MDKILNNYIKKIGGDNKSIQLDQKLQSYRSIEAEKNKFEAEKNKCEAEKNNLLGIQTSNQEDVNILNKEINNNKDIIRDLRVKLMNAEAAIIIDRSMEDELATYKADLAKSNSDAAAAAVAATARQEAALIVAKKACETGDAAKDAAAAKALSEALAKASSDCETARKEAERLANLALATAVAAEKTICTNGPIKELTQLRTELSTSLVPSIVVDQKVKTDQPTTLSRIIELKDKEKNLEEKIASMGNLDSNLKKTEELKGKLETAIGNIENKALTTRTSPIDNININKIETDIINRIDELQGKANDLDKTVAPKLAEVKTLKEKFEAAMNEIDASANDKAPIVPAISLDKADDINSAKQDIISKINALRATTAALGTKGTADAGLKAKLIETVNAVIGITTNKLHNLDSDSDIDTTKNEITKNIADTEAYKTQLLNAMKFIENLTCGETILDDKNVEAVKNDISIIISELKIKGQLLDAKGAADAGLAPLVASLQGAINDIDNYTLDPVAAPARDLNNEKNIKETSKDIKANIKALKDAKDDLNNIRQCLAENAGIDIQSDTTKALNRVEELKEIQEKLKGFRFTNKNLLGLRQNLANKYDPSTKTIIQDDSIEKIQKIAMEEITRLKKNDILLYKFKEAINEIDAETQNNVPVPPIVIDTDEESKIDTAVSNIKSKIQGLKAGVGAGDSTSKDLNEILDSTIPLSNPVDKNRPNKDTAKNRIEKSVESIDHLNKVLKQLSISKIGNSSPNIDIETDKDAAYNRITDLQDKEVSEYLLRTAVQVTASNGLDKILKESVENNTPNLDTAIARIDKLMNLAGKGEDALNKLKDMVPKTDLDTIKEELKNLKDENVRLTKELAAEKTRVKNLTDAAPDAATIAKAATDADYAAAAKVALEDIEQKVFPAKTGGFTGAANVGSITKLKGEINTEITKLIATVDETNKIKEDIKAIELKVVETAIAVGATNLDKVGALTKVIQNIKAALIPFQNYKNFFNYGGSRLIKFAKAYPKVGTVFDATALSTRFGPLNDSSTVENMLTRIEELNTDAAGAAAAGDATAAKEAIRKIASLMIPEAEADPKTKDIFKIENPAFLTEVPNKIIAKHQLIGTMLFDNKMGIEKIGLQKSMFLPKIPVPKEVNYIKYYSMDDIKNGIYYLEQMIHLIGASLDKKAFGEYTMDQILKMIKDLNASAATPAVTPELENIRTALATVPTNSPGGVSKGYIVDNNIKNYSEADLIKYIQTLKVAPAILDTIIDRVKLYLNPNSGPPAFTALSRQIDVNSTNIIQNFSMIMLAIEGIQDDLSKFKKKYVDNGDLYEEVQDLIYYAENGNWRGGSDKFKSVEVIKKAKKGGSKREKYIAEIKELKKILNK